MPIDINKLLENAEIPEPSRDIKGFHTLSFKDEEITIKNKEGKTIETLNMSDNGWKELEKFLKTKSPSVMAKRLIVISYNANRTK